MSVKPQALISIPCVLPRNTPTDLLTAECRPSNIRLKPCELRPVSLGILSWSLQAGSDVAPVIHVIGALCWLPSCHASNM